MNKSIKLIESYLPVFTGFYNTIFEADEEICIEEGKTYEDYKWDYEEYHQRVAKSCAVIVGEQLKDLGIKVEFKALVSPKYYNYTNDSINVAYHLDGNAFTNLLKYVLDNKDDFDGFIEHNYTSYDGFMSFFSNDGTEWLTEYIFKEEKLNHVFGACLEFYLEMEEFCDEQLAEKLSEQGDNIVYGELIETAE
jgi:ABC-type transport system substrate-binding protein